MRKTLGKSSSKILRILQVVFHFKYRRRRASNSIESSRFTALRAPSDTVPSSPHLALTAQQCLAHLWYFFLQVFSLMQFLSERFVVSAGRMRSFKTSVLTSCSSLFLEIFSLQIWWFEVDFLLSWLACKVGFCLAVLHSTHFVLIDRPIRKWIPLYKGHTCVFHPLQSIHVNSKRLFSLYFVVAFYSLLLC